ncbi:hypothetical protein LHFGNBLO_001335 [Mesorhizobium sp. AR10]|uniref:hypothetical protein n=1 Tax=Mesorhizobium sp. AR10 TaxID=2865839 RepID=UPI00215FF115|nr:hypothetical protein [Mesorhizobium sp. AR10]UVK39920.1 hypothetical protein LHFGNBLO_001335 [Mesorhizobium sp. AR10]
MRDYSKISPKVWRSPRFRSQSDDSRLLYVYLLTCEHQSSAGCFRLPDAYAAENLNWPVERVLAARAPLVACELVAHDPKKFEYFILRWFRHNPTTNPKHLQGVMRLISELDSDPIREVAEAELEESLENKGRTSNVVSVTDKLSGQDRLTGSKFLSGNGRG